MNPKTMFPDEIDRSLFEMLFDDSSVGLYVYGNSRFYVVNHRFSEIFGYSAQEVIEGPCMLETIVHPEDFPVVLENVKKRLSGEAVIDRYRVRCIHKNGHVLHVELICGKKETSIGSVVFGAVIDVTQQVLSEQMLQVSEQRYRSLYAHHSSAIYSIDLTGRFTSCNEACQKLSGYDKDEFIGALFTDLMLEAEAEKVNKLFMEVIHNREARSYDTQVYHKDGHEVDLSVTNIPIVIDDEIVGVYGVATDITERKRVEEKLQQSEARFRLLVQNSGDIFSIVDRDQIIRYTSPAVERVLGFKAEELQGRHVCDLLEDSYKQQVLSEYDTLSEIPKSMVWNSEVLVRDAGGKPRPFEVSRVNLIGEPGIDGFVVNLRDITERKKAQEQIEYIAFHDYLTDLPNRRLFERHLQSTIQAAREQGDAVALIYIDLDRFKAINDTLGHYVGDELIVEVARRLRAQMGTQEFAARLGGDEFAVVRRCREPLENVLNRAKELLEAIDQPAVIRSFELYPTASIGVSMFPMDGEDGESLFRKADIALYQAKDLGGKTVQAYSGNPRYAGDRILSLSGELRKAIQRNELTVHYQPIVCAESGRIACAEALLRWNHSTLGRIPPDEFIPIAEETGLIVPIGEWVFRQACEQQKRWERKGLPPVRVAINFSVQQLMHRDILPSLKQILKETGVNPDYLEVEITESSVTQNELFLTDVLQQIREMGIRIAVDDFGTGFTSLAFLKRSVMDTLKIDKSYVQGITSDDRTASIIEALISLAHKLGICVVAEGVETGEQVECLRTYQCDQLQGYYYFKPMSGGEMEQVLLGVPETGTAS